MKLTRLFLTAALALSLGALVIAQRLDLVRIAKIERGIKSSHAFSKADRDYILSLARSPIPTVWLKADTVYAVAADNNLFSHDLLHQITEEQTIDTRPSGVFPGALEYASELHISYDPSTAEQAKRFIAQNPKKLTSGEEQFVAKASDQVSAVCVIISKSHMDRAGYKWSFNHLVSLVKKKSGPQKDYFMFIMRVFQRRNRD